MDKVSGGVKFQVIVCVPSGLVQGARSDPTGD
jgi:hypothetical protein